MSTIVPPYLKGARRRSEAKDFTTERAEPPNAANQQFTPYLGDWVLRQAYGDAKLKKKIAADSLKITSTQIHDPSVSRTLGVQGNIG